MADAVVTAVIGNNYIVIPGSHHYRTADDAPSNPISHMIPFEADAGSIVAMEGRVWHTSGRNVTESEDRALLFGALPPRVGPVAESSEREDFRGASRPVGADR